MRNVLSRTAAFTALLAASVAMQDVIAGTVQVIIATPQESLKSPDAIEKTRATGMTMRHLTPQQLDAVVKNDLAYWSKVITSAKIKAD
jgi:hypothetical protein